MKEPYEVINDPSLGGRVFLRPLRSKEISKEDQLETLAYIAKTRKEIRKRDREMLEELAKIQAHHEKCFRIEAVVLTAILILTFIALIAFSFI